MADTPSLIFDMRQFAAFDPGKHKTRVSRPVPRSALSTGQQSALRTLLDSPLGATVPNRDAIREAFRIVDARDCNVTILPGPGMAVPHVYDVTIGIGFAVTAAAVVTVAAGGGLYFSSLPEAGVYVSAGGGLTTNVSFFAGGAVTIVFGPPSTFAGEAIAVGADFSLPPPSPLGWGGAVLFPVTPPYVLIGVVFQFGFAPSMLRMDATIQVSSTQIAKF